jgi:hypothetical protein
MAERISRMVSYGEGRMHTVYENGVKSTIDPCKIKGDLLDVVGYVE